MRQLRRFLGPIAAGLFLILGDLVEAAGALKRDRSVAGFPRRP